MQNKKNKSAFYNYKKLKLFVLFFYFFIIYTFRPASFFLLSLHFFPYGILFVHSQLFCLWIHLLSRLENDTEMVWPIKCKNRNANSWILTQKWNYLHFCEETMQFQSEWIYSKKWILWERKNNQICTLRSRFVSRPNNRKYFHLQSLNECHLMGRRFYRNVELTKNCVYYCPMIAVVFSKMNFQPSNQFELGGLPTSKEVKKRKPFFFWSD